MELNHVYNIFRNSRSCELLTQILQIRVYYVSADNKLKQVSYDGGSGWNRDTLGTSFFLAPNSKVAAVFVSQDGNLDVRVYAQLPNNTIQEFGPGEIHQLLSTSVF